MKKILAVAAVLGVLLSANAFACSTYRGIYKINSAGEKVIVGMERVPLKVCPKYVYNGAKESNSNSSTQKVESAVTNRPKTYTYLGKNINDQIELRDDQTGDTVLIHK